MYQKMYETLFNAVTDALEAIEQRNYGAAEALLEKAQVDVERIYISWEGEEEP